MANIWDRILDQADDAIEKGLQAGLYSAANQFGINLRPNQDPSAQEIAAGQLGQQPDSTIYERNVQDASMLKNNFFDISGFMSNPIAIVGSLIGLAIVLALFVRGKK